MRTFLTFTMLLLISGAASSVQEPQRGATQTGQAKPYDAATTQAELNKCSGEEYLKIDEHLNAVYKNLLRMLQEVTHDAKQPQDEAETALQKLRAAQIACDQYRALPRDAVQQQFEGGSIAPLEWATCMTETANHRIAERKRGEEIGDRKFA